MNRFFQLTFFLILFSGCNYSMQKNPGAPDNQDLSLDSKIISYDTVRTYAIQTCLKCHSGSTRPSLASLSDLKNNFSKVLSEVRDGAMPPPSSGYPDLSNCQKAILHKWQDLGEPETSDVSVKTLAECSAGLGDNPDPNTPPPILSEPVNYNTMLNRILKPRCLSCHNKNDTTDASSILFFPYSEFKNNKNLIKRPGATSKLVRMLTRTDEDRMPPPETGAPLASDEIEFVKRFIDQGIPEN